MKTADPDPQHAPCAPPEPTPAARRAAAIEGVISHIQRFSVHDGPGIRTTVFLKGCQMRCPWCHNPETYRRQPELQVFAERCIGCAACVEQCGQRAHEIIGERHAFHRDRCIACGRCAETCYAQGVVLVGKTRTAREVVEEVLVDREFYASSQGGVTISGGEPLVQPEFTGAILELCKQKGIHTAVETNLAQAWSTIAAMLPKADLLLVDIKFLDDTEHRRWTGASNRPVLENLLNLARENKPVMVRTPIIGGLNDRPEHVRAIADWLRPLTNILRYELLPYHPLGTGKYAALGYAPPPSQFQVPSPQDFERLTAIARLDRESEGRNGVASDAK